MSIESEPKPPVENFIGDLSFGITPEFIQSHFRELEEELAKINEELVKEDTPEQLRRFAEGRKAKTERVLKVSTDEIFRLLQEIYDLVHESEQSGLAKADILRKLKTENPQLAEAVGTFYGILRSQVWGYRLGQALLAFRG
jgi:hypothetical protein